jgi:hypothetical protein
MNIGRISNSLSKIASLNDAQRFIFYKYLSDSLYRFAKLDDDFDDSYIGTGTVDSSFKGDLTPDLISKAELIKSLSLSGNKSDSDRIMDEVLSSASLTAKQKKDFKKYVTRIMLAGSSIGVEDQPKVQDSNFVYQSKDMSNSFSLLGRINSEVSKIHPDIFNIIYNKQNQLYSKCRTDLNYERRLQERYLGILADNISDVVSSPGFTYFEQDPNRLQASSFEYFYHNPSHIPQDVMKTLASCMGSNNPDPKTASKCLWRNADKRLISDNSTSIRNACLEEMLERIIRKEPAMMCFLVRILLRHTNKIFSESKRSVRFDTGLIGDFQKNLLQKNIINRDLIEFKKSLINEFTSHDRLEEAGFSQQENDDPDSSLVGEDQDNSSEDDERENNLEIVRNFYPSFIELLERKKSELDLFFNYIINGASDESVYGNLKDICNKIKNDLIGVIDEEIDAVRLDMDKNSYKIAVSIIKKMKSSGNAGFTSEIRKNSFEFKIRIKRPDSISDRDINIISGVDISLMPSYSVSIEGVPGWSKESGYKKIQLIKQKFDRAYDEFTRGSTAFLSTMMSDSDVKKRIIGWYKTATRGIKINPETKRRSISSDEIRDKLSQSSLTGDSLKSYLSGLITSRSGNENLKLFLDKVKIGMDFGQQVRGISSFRENFRSLILKISKDAEMPPSVFESGMRLFSTQSVSEENQQEEKTACFDSMSQSFLRKMSSYIRSR